MKVEGYVFGVTALFFLIVAPVYWFLSFDPAGTAALFLTFGLCGLIGFYLTVTSRRIEPRPEDRKDAEIIDGVGELGFFSPHSVWPLLLGLSVAFAVMGIVIGWWMFIIGATFVAITVSLFTFEYYRGAYEG